MNRSRSVLVNYIAQREGGFEKLKGKKIATLYHDSAYGRETLDPLALLSKKYGFEDIQIPISNAGAGLGGNAHAANEFYVIEGSGKVYGMAGAEKVQAAVLYNFAGKN